MRVGISNLKVIAMRSKIEPELFRYFFSAFCLNLSYNNNQTLFFNALPFARFLVVLENLGLRPPFSASPSGPGKR